MEIPESTLWMMFAASNLFALLVLWASWKAPNVGRALFAALFAWASWMNWKTALQQPELYLDYAKTAIPAYRGFIEGWFNHNIAWFVGAIATGQAMIALLMLGKGVGPKLGALGAIVFLLAIAPLGLYAGFPFEMTASVAAFIVGRRRYDKSLPATVLEFRDQRHFPDRLPGARS